MHPKTLEKFKKSLMNNGEQGTLLLKYIESLELENKNLKSENKKFKFKIVALETQTIKKFKPVDENKIIQELKSDIYNLRQELSHYRKKIKENVKYEVNR